MIKRVFFYFDDIYGMKEIRNYLEIFIIEFFLRFINNLRLINYVNNGSN